MKIEKVDVVIVLTSTNTDIGGNCESDRGIVIDKLELMKEGILTGRRNDWKV